MHAPVVPSKTIPDSTPKQAKCFQTKKVQNSYPSIIPLSPNIEIQILQTDLYTFPLRISEGNLIKDQSIFS